MRYRHEFGANTLLVTAALRYDRHRLHGRRKWYQAEKLEHSLARIPELMDFVGHDQIDITRL